MELALVPGLPPWNALPWRLRVCFRFRWVHPNGAIIGSYKQSALIGSPSVLHRRKQRCVAEHAYRRDKIASPLPTESSIAMSIMDRRVFLGYGLSVFL